VVYQSLLGCHCRSVDVVALVDYACENDHLASQQGLLPGEFGTSRTQRRREPDLRTELVAATLVHEPLFSGDRERKARLRPAGSMITE
jgi:hypothetical protein